MAIIKVVLPTGSMVAVGSSEHDAESLRRVIDLRQQIATDYCIKNGWPTDFEKLSFEQIMGIRALPEWVKAGE